MEEELNQFTGDEMRALIENMPEEDAQQLWVWSVTRCGGNEDAAQDLHQDTLLALMEQRYPWKKAVPFRAQMYWVNRRIKSADMKKPATTRLVTLAVAAGIEARTDGSDPEKSLVLKGTDDVYGAVRDKLPEGSYARTLWEVMYVNEVHAIKEQVEVLDWPEDRVRTARKLIKERCREVFKRFGIKVEKLTKGTK